MKKIVCGVIGCGVIAPDHIRTYQTLEDVEVRWVCDLIRDRVERRAQEFNVPRRTLDYHEVLADPQVDCISVCTDHAGHVPVVSDALENGKDVLCEKALAASAEGLGRMFGTFKRFPDRIFSGVFQHRFEKVYRYVKQLVNDGSFGKLLTATLNMACVRSDQYYAADSWRGTWAQEGGAVLINQSIHFVDLLGWIMGGVKSVGGVYANLTHGNSIEAEDTVAASLVFSCGALGTIAATSSSNLDWRPTISIRGSKGSLDIVNTVPILTSFADPEQEKLIKGEFEKCKEQSAYVPEKTYYGPGHPSQITDFIDAVRNRRQPFVKALSARHAVDIVLGIYESHRKGSWINIGSSPDI